MTRHELREEVFRVIFGMDTQLSGVPQPTPEEVARLYLSESCDSEPSEKEAGLIISKAAAIGSMLDELDSSIDSVARGWKVRRMGKAELNILRLALYEIRYDETVPVKVAINEAVELAKEYCGDDAPAFVNGILAHFV